MKKNNSRLLIAFNCFFIFTNKLQKITLILENHKIQNVTKKVACATYIMLLILATLYLFLPSVSSVLFIIVYILYATSTSLINPSKSFTSLRAFISTGFYGTTIAALLIIGFIHYIVDIKSIAVSAGIFLLLYFSIESYVKTTVIYASLLISFAWSTRQKSRLFSIHSAKALCGCF